MKKNHLIKYLFSILLLFGLLISCQTEEIFIKNQSEVTHKKNPKVNYLSGKSARMAVDKLNALLKKLINKSSNGNYLFMRYDEQTTVDFSKIMEVIDEAGNINYTYKVIHPESSDLKFFNLVLTSKITGEAYVKLFKYEMDPEYAEKYYDGLKTINQFKGEISYVNIVYSSCCPDPSETIPFPVDLDQPINDGNTGGGYGPISGGFPNSGTNTFGGGVLGFGLTHSTWGSSVGSDNSSGSNNNSSTNNSTSTSSNNNSSSTTNSGGTPTQALCQFPETETIYGSDGTTVIDIIVRIVWRECAPTQNRNALVFSLVTYNSDCPCPGSGLSNPNDNIGVLDPDFNFIEELQPYLSDEILSWLERSQANIYDQVKRYLISNNSDYEFIAEIVTTLFNNEADDYDLTSDITFLISENSSNESKKEIKLKVATNSSNVPWTLANGSYNNVPTLAYNGVRTIMINSTPLVQYKLNNGDFLSTGDYGIWQDNDFRVYYYSTNKKYWFQIPEPNNYNHTNLEFLFNQFWSIVQTGVRICTPLEEIIVLIDGKDFDGVTQSKAVAGLFVIIDITPAGKVAKITRRAGHTLSAVSPVVAKVLTNLEKAQRKVKKQYKDIISGMNSTRKGNFGEICTDVDFFEKGYQALHTRRVTGIDDVGGHQGIDHIFKNPETGEFIIVESKYHGTGGLSTLTDGTRQMSDVWIRGNDPNVLNNNNRLWIALDQNTNLYNQIINNGYTRVVAYIQPDGVINYKYVTPEGVEISTIFTN